jgi:hypothetical protein
MMTLAHPIFVFAVPITIALTSCATGRKSQSSTEKASECCGVREL